MFARKVQVQAFLGTGTYLGAFGNLLEADVKTEKKKQKEKKNLAGGRGVAHRKRVSSAAGSQFCFPSVPRNCWIREDASY